MITSTKQFAIYLIILFIKEEEFKFVPNKQINEKTKERRKVPLDKPTLCAIRKKHRCWQRYMETKSEEKYLEYTRQRLKAKTMMRKLQNNIERDISKKAKTNSKLFWSYIRKNTKLPTEIPGLYKGEGKTNMELAETDKEKAEVLSNCFNSVYKREPNGNIPSLEDRQYNGKLENFEISTTKIEDLLMKLKIDKSPGPDSLHPRILK